MTDTLPGLSAITAAASPRSRPLATVTCTATYVVTQADVDAGVINNTATVTGQTATAGPVSDDDTLATPLTKTPSVKIVKSSNATADDGGGRHDHVQLPGHEQRQRHDHVVRRHRSARRALADRLRRRGVAGAGRLRHVHRDLRGDAGRRRRGWDRQHGDGERADRLGPRHRRRHPPDAADQDPELTLVKSGVLDMTVVAPTGRADAGDRIVYTLTASNSGNTTLTASP